MTTEKWQIRVEGGRLCIPLQLVRMLQRSNISHGGITRVCIGDTEDSVSFLDVDCKVFLAIEAGMLEAK